MGEYFFEGGVLDEVRKVTSRKRTSFDVTAENSEDTRLSKARARRLFLALSTPARVLST
jgi:hypothetical protein